MNDHPQCCDEAKGGIVEWIDSPGWAGPPGWYVETASIRPNPVRYCPYCGARLPVPTAGEIDAQRNSK